MTFSAAKSPQSAVNPCNPKILILEVWDYVNSQFFDDVRDVIRKAPAKELVDLPEGHDAKLGEVPANQIISDEGDYSKCEGLNLLLS